MNRQTITLIHRLDEYLPSEVLQEMGIDINLARLVMNVRDLDRLNTSYVLAKIALAFIENKKDASR
jgi:hypothetical protein